ncbi:hypothetical protein J6590_078924 [Homalodisca vitripennis]|nr:hypothetical protein J6590_099975 [Homalodisca vitripennis]KAG8329785.1 hypothetical protein J6590_078924 [Homalodisca vitripennis]
MELSTKLSSLEKHGEPTPKMAIKELTRKAGYRILEAKKVDTKFDRKAVMLLVEVDSTKTAVTFLPVRFEKTLDDSDLQEMTSSKRYKVRCTDVNGLLVDNAFNKCSTVVNTCVISATPPPPGYFYIAVGNVFLFFLSTVARHIQADDGRQYR